MIFKLIKKIHFQEKNNKIAFHLQTILINIIFLEHLTQIFFLPNFTQIFMIVINLK